MKSTLALTAALLVLCPLTALADTTLTYPQGGPGLSITFPEGWEAAADKEDATSLTVTSPDESIELNLWALDKTADPKKMLEQLEDTAKSVASDIGAYVEGFEIKESKKGTLNGLTAAMFGGIGKSKEDGEEVNVEVHYFSPDGKQVFVLMYWGSDEAEEANKAALAKISASIKKS